jgi:hypothetical protein
MQPWTTARIENAGETLYEIKTSGYNGYQAAGQYGFRTERELFNAVRRKAKKAGRDVSGWKLVLVPAKDWVHE